MIRALGAVAVAIALAYIAYAVVDALPERRLRRQARREMVIDDIIQEQARSNYHNHCAAIRRLERVHEVDDQIPFLSRKDRQENEDVITAFYENQPPKGK